MKNKLKRILCIIIIISFSGSFGGVGTAHAASAAIVLSCKGSTIQKGTSLTVTVTVRSTETIGQVQLYLSYDESVFTYKKGSNYVSGGNGFVEISDTSVKNTSARKYTVTFETVGTGTVKMAVCENPTVIDANGNAMSVSSNFISITAKDGPDKETDCALKDLSCQEGELAPAFSPECYAYEIEVSHEVEKLHFNAQVRSKKATAVLSGDELLHDGENVIRITVTAEAGNSQDYLIRVYRSTKEEDMEKSAKQSGFSVISEENQVRMVSYHTYNLKELPKETEIPKGYVETGKMIKGELVTAFVPEENPDSCFYLVYASCEGKAARFYQVDEEEGTLQRYQTQDEQNEVFSSEREGQSGEEKGVLLLIGGIFLILIVVSGMYFLVKKRNND